MRPSRFVHSWLVLVAAFAAVGACAGDAEDPGGTPGHDGRGAPTASLLATRAAPDDTAQVVACLQAAGFSTVHVAKDRASWIDSKADLHVLRGPSGEREPRSDAVRVPAWTHAEVHALRRCRLLAIGQEGGELLAKIGVRMGDGVWFDAIQRVRLEPCVRAFGLEPAIRRSRSPYRGGGGLLKTTVGGIGLAEWEDLAMFVQPILRWEGEYSEFAPFVRHGSYAWSLLAEPATEWQPWLQDLYGRVALVLARTEVGSGQSLRWPDDLVGQHKVTLYGTSSRGRQGFLRHLRVVDSGVLTVRVRATSPIALNSWLGRAHADQRFLWAEQSEDAAGVTWVIPLNASVIAWLDGGSLELDVHRLRDGAPTTCSAQIDLDRGGVIRISEDLSVDINRPPIDEQTIRKLIQLAVETSDRDLLAKALGALFAIGPPAVTLVDDAMWDADHPLPESRATLLAGLLVAIEDVYD